MPESRVLNSRRSPCLGEPLRQQALGPSDGKVEYDGTFFRCDVSPGNVFGLSTSIPDHHVRRLASKLLAQRVADSSGGLIMKTIATYLTLLLGAGPVFAADQ